MHQQTRHRLRAALLPAVLLFALITPLHAHVTVLMYHKFDAADSPSTSVSTDFFTEQMEYLKTNGYTVIGLEQLARIVEGTEPVPEKAVVITLDDGHITEYTGALPILKRYGYPYSVFIFSHGTDRPHYLSAEQIREIDASGGTIGAHTHLHPHLINVGTDRARSEIIRSKQILEEITGHEIPWFAYPFGEYDQEIRKICKEAGFRLMLTSDPGTVHADTPADLVPRQAIVGKNMTMKKFAAKLATPPLPVTGRSPAAGRLSSATLPGIRVRLEDPDQYLPGQINMFVSEKGRMDATFDPATGWLTCDTPLTLTRKANRISVTARRKSDRLFARESWMIVLPEKE